MSLLDPNLEVILSGNAEMTRDCLESHVKTWSSDKLEIGPRGRAGRLRQGSSSRLSLHLRVVNDWIDLGNIILSNLPNNKTLMRFVKVTTDPKLDELYHDMQEMLLRNLFRLGFLELSEEQKPRLGYLRE